MTNETNTNEQGVQDCLPADFYAHAYDHYAAALRKCPRFADALFAEEDEFEDAATALERALKEVAYLDAHGGLAGETIVLCELAEAEVAHKRGDTAACAGKLYDAVATIMRMISVVEGRQKLGGKA